MGLSQIAFELGSWSTRRSQWYSTRRQSDYWTKSNSSSIRNIGTNDIIIQISKLNALSDENLFPLVCYVISTCERNPSLYIQQLLLRIYCISGLVYVEASRMCSDIRILP